MRVPQTYRSLLRAPGVPSLLAAGLIGRLPVGIVSLALVLFVHARGGGFALGGAVAGAYALVQGALAPLLGRLVDRAGQTRTLTITGTLNAVLLVGVVVAGLHGAAPVVLVMLAGAAGAARPPLSACVRQLLSAILGAGSELDSAYALESVVVEIIFISGPVLTAVLAAAGSPAAALLCAAALTLSGTLWLAWSAQARAWRPAGPTADGARVFAVPGMRTIIAGALVLGAAFGMLEVAMPAFAAAHGSAAAGGLALAGMALGSLAAGLWYGARNRTGPLVSRYLLLGVLFATGFVPLVFAPTVAVMVALMALAGLFLAPLGTCTYMLIDRIAPPGTLTEAFTWLTSANVAGAAAGNALAGAIAQAAGVRWALAAAAACAAGAAAVSVARRGTLTPTVDGGRFVAAAAGSSTPV